MRPGLTIVALAIVAVLLAWCMPGGNESYPHLAPSEITAPHTPAAAVTAAPQREQLPGVTPSAAVNSTPTTAPTEDEAPWAPYRLFVRTVDERGERLGGATVSIHQPGKNEALSRNLTDANGECAVDVDSDWVSVTASRDDLVSHDIRIWHAHYRSGKLLELELWRQLYLRGVVLRADGTPAPGVYVSLDSSARSVMPLRTGTDGRFEFPIERERNYGIHASLGGVTAFPAGVSTISRYQDQEVALRFPGTTSVRGLVAAPDGQPIAGSRVRLWEILDSQASDADYASSFRAEQQSANDGHFHIDVPRPTRYWLLATGKGYASSTLVTVEVSTTTPHPETRLRLQQPTIISGIVRYASGQPAAGATVFLEAESGIDAGGLSRPTRQDQFPAFGGHETDRSGTFRFEGVHPGTTWTLGCVPDPKQRPSVAAYRKGIRPGTEDLDFTLTEADTRGAVLRGRVFDPEGRPTDRFELELAWYRDGKIAGKGAVAGVTITGGRFELAITAGTTVGILVVPESCAPTLLGPIEARADNPEFTVQLRPFATLICRVVTANGKPAPRFAIGAEPRTNRAIAPPIASRTDDDGIARFTKCTPGIHEIAVWENRTKLATVEVDLLPGTNPDIVLRLPN